MSLVDRIVERLGEPGRFVIVGGGASAVHMGSVTALLLAFPNLSVMMANFAAICLAFAFSFYGHMRFTFSRAGHLPSFVVTALIGMAVNNAVVAGVLYLGGPAFFAIPAGMAAAAAGTFFLSRRFAFAVDGETKRVGDNVQ